VQYGTVAQCSMALHCALLHGEGLGAINKKRGIDRPGIISKRHGIRP
jgi:hypothetical protein